MSEDNEIESGDDRSVDTVKGVRGTAAREEEVAAQQLLKQQDADDGVVGEHGGEDSDFESHDYSELEDSDDDEALGEIVPRAALRQRIEDLIKPAIETEGFKLYEFEPPYRSGSVLRVYIWKGQVSGKAQGVILDECARVSKALEFLTGLDEAIEGTYILEVSSPGVNRKLSRLEHFESAVGEHAKIVTLKGEVFFGPIKSVADGVIAIESSIGERDDGADIVRKKGKRSPSHGARKVVELARVAFADVKRARIDFQF